MPSCLYSEDNDYFLGKPHGCEWGALCGPHSDEPSQMHDHTGLIRILRTEH